MNSAEGLKDLLTAVKEGRVPVSGALETLRNLPFQDIGHTKIDFHRTLRNGIPEVIYGEGKTTEQILDIFSAMAERGNILATRVGKEAAAGLRAAFPDAVYHPEARTLTLVQDEIRKRPGYIAVVTAGTADLPVAEEARVTCEMMGSPARVITDIGVAGVHRLFSRLDLIRRAAVIIVVAGMEGALASVIGGLVDRPVIGVPTSVGYGAGFGGISALLAMLTSCAAGITVVNIDNGFGAACAACRIHQCDPAS
ncbi:MAG: 1-(5-phosphoribosyl)-5-amino-4-imidazole-carboxylate carboxylase [Desulfobacterales bacterium]|nr:MAG: 1-(5-phosphoribosyl)-5-amino-4-imidazole-carboxylate carboxylase [Desulfobacterales bacterium]